MDERGDEAARQGLVRRIEELKRTRDAVVLAHYYVAPEVQEVADHVGDSFALARLAVSLPEQTVVVAGVQFMGESMKLLNPAKTVLLPAPGADCPMAHMVARATIEDARRRYGDDVAVVCYVNSTAALKSLSDVCVTSSNAVRVVRALPEHHVLFIPDEHLGRFVARQVPEKHILLNDGCCPYHARITADAVRELKRAYPAAPVLAHPECAEDVLALADVIGSTAELIEAAAASDACDLIVVTMAGVEAEVARRCGKRCHFVAGSSCPEMGKVTLEALARCLETGSGEVALPAPEVAEPAARALTRMLELAKRGA